MLKRLAILAAILASSGCSMPDILSGGPSRDVFELRSTGPAMTCARAGAAELVVEPPKAAGPIDSKRILIRPNPLQVQYLPDAEWGDSVPVMVQTALVRRLGAFPLYSHVGRAPLGSSGDYALLSEIREFGAMVEGSGTVITLNLDAQIVNEMSARVVARRSFSVTRPVPSTKTGDLIIGFDSAGQDLFNQIGLWAADALGGGCRPAG